MNEQNAIIKQSLMEAAYELVSTACNVGDSGITDDSRATVEAVIQNLRKAMG